MDTPRDNAVSQAPMLALEAIRIAEESARAAERSAASALATLERAEQSLAASEQRMVEITAAASSAASEATEARLRATEVAADLRSLEERVAEALRIGADLADARLSAVLRCDPRRHHCRVRGALGLLRPQGRSHRAETERAGGSNHDRYPDPDAAGPGA
jgi:hypothetical protein